MESFIRERQKMITTSIKLTGLTALRKSLGDDGVVLDAAAGSIVEAVTSHGFVAQFARTRVSRIGRYRGVNRQSEPPRTCMNHALRRPVESQQHKADIAGKDTSAETSDRHSTCAHLSS